MCMADDLLCGIKVHSRHHITPATAVLQATRSCSRACRTLCSSTRSRGTKRRCALDLSMSDAISGKTAGSRTADPFGCRVPMLQGHVRMHCGIVASAPTRSHSSENTYVISICCVDPVALRRWPACSGTTSAWAWTRLARTASTSCASARPGPPPAASSTRLEPVPPAFPACPRSDSLLRGGPSGCQLNSLWSPRSSLGLSICQTVAKSCQSFSQAWYSYYGLSTGWLTGAPPIRRKVRVWVRRCCLPCAMSHRTGLPTRTVFSGSDHARVSHHQARPVLQTTLQKWSLCSTPAPIYLYTY